MQTVPSSSGWRMTSRTLRGNLRQFVEKEHAVVGQRNFAGTRDRAAADQSGVGDGVVRRAEGADADQAGACIEHSGHAVNLGGLQRFLEA